MFFLFYKNNFFRNEIASCLEKSYKKLQFKDARTMLLFDNENEAIAFGKLVSLTLVDFLMIYLLYYM